MPHADHEPRPTHDPNRPLYIEALIAAECRTQALFRGSISIAVGSVAPMLERKEILDAINQMIEAGRLAEQPQHFDQLGDLPRYALADPPQAIPASTFREIEDVLYKEYDYRDDNGDLDLEIRADGDCYVATIKTHCDDYAMAKGETGSFSVTMSKQNGKWEMSGECGE